MRQQTLFGYGPFHEIGQEFDSFCAAIKSTYGTPPGRAFISPVREFITGALDKLAVAAFSLGALEAIIDWQVGAPLKEWAAKVVALNKTAYPLGAIVANDHALSVSHFTTIALSAALAAMLASRILRVHPQNEQARSRTAISHLWSCFIKAQQQTDWQVAFNTLCTLQDQKNNYPHAFQQAFYPPGNKYTLDSKQFSRLQAFALIHLYHSSRETIHLVQAENYLKRIDNLNDSMKDWFTKEKQGGEEKPTGTN